MKGCSDRRCKEAHLAAAGVRWAFRFLLSRSCWSVLSHPSGEHWPLRFCAASWLTHGKLEKGRACCAEKHCCVCDRGGKSTYFGNIWPYLWYRGLRPHYQSPHTASHFPPETESWRTSHTELVLQEHTHQVQASPGLNGGTMQSLICLIGSTWPWQLWFPIFNHINVN